MNVRPLSIIKSKDSIPFKNMVGDDGGRLESEGFLATEKFGTEDTVMM